MAGHYPKGDAPESVPPLTSMPGVYPETPPGPPAGDSFEDMLADPNGQFDLRSELLASISAYAAAPPASAGIQPGEPDRPFPARVTGPTSVYLGPVAHTWTSACAGHHPVSGPCPSSVTGYGPTADAIRAEVDADNAKDAEILRLHNVIALKNRELAELAPLSIAADRDRLDRDRFERDLTTAISEQDRIAADLRKASAANQKWAETLSDVQLRHAGVKRERNEAREKVASYKRAAEQRAAELTDLDAAYRQLDGLREVHWLARQQAEGERDQAREQLRQAREAFAKLAGRFTDTRQSGWTARVSGTVLRRLCVAAAVEPPDGSGQQAQDEALVGELAELIPLTMARSTRTLAGDVYRDVARAVLDRMEQP